MRIKNILLTVLAILLLALGTIGAFLPILPTTPFVLAAVACLSSNPKLRNKITRIPFFKEYLDNYKNRQGLSKKVVTQSLVFLWGMLIISMIAIAKLWLIILLFTIGTAVTIHILWMAGVGKRGREKKLLKDKIMTRNEEG